jgi:hypothetical protein
MVAAAWQAEFRRPGAAERMLGEPGQDDVG